MSGQRHVSCKTCHTEVGHVLEILDEFLVLLVGHPPVDAWWGV